MSEQPPLGRREDLHLEFKGRDALRQPDSIAREVVALLNAEGGDVWVGIREASGVAVEIEGLVDPERERDRLRDSLVDLLEPQPRSDEVQIEVVGGRDRLLRISTKPRPERRPYALRRGGRMEFPIRFENRLRPMTRSEIEDTFASARSRGVGGAAEAQPAEERALRDDQQETLKLDQPTFWLGVEPTEGDKRLDLHGLEASGLLEDPILSGNRRIGINFRLALHAVLFVAEPAAARVDSHQDRSWLTVGRKMPFELSVGETGGLRSSVRLDEHPFFLPPIPERSPFPELRDARILNPKALLEYPASLFRLLRALGEHGLLRKELGDLFAAVAVANVEGWYIQPGPDHPAWDYPIGLHPLPPALQRRPRPFTDGPSFVGPVLRLSERDLRASPDSCALRLMIQVFAAFGWLESEIPYFNRERRRLEFLD